MARNARSAALASTLVSWLLAGCATMGGQAAHSLVPTRYETRTGPYVVYTNAPIAPEAVAIRELQSLERELEAALGVRVEPGDHPIEVYILGDRPAFEHFLKFYYPELPSRRAFFLAQGERRVVYTYFGDHLKVDLRHEATHALLHVAAAELPLWLDEGLAEYFEDPAQRGLNGEHLAKLPDDFKQGWTPDLRRLEAIKDVRLMSPRDYREAWAWVHYMLDGQKADKTALLGYLADLRTTRKSESLSERLLASGENPGTKLVAHIERLRPRPATSVQIETESTVRLQNAPDPSRTAEAHHRGLLNRLRELFDPKDPSEPQADQP
jgi:hypothetical protein